MRPLMLGLVLTLAGCAGAPPPSATGIPWDPNLLTVQRQAAADRWAADVARRAFIAGYMSTLCAADGPWATMNDAWGKALAREWSDVLWRFQPIPNVPASSSVDWGALVGALIGGAVKAAPLLAVTPPKPALPPGLPPC